MRCDAKPTDRVAVSSCWVALVLRPTISGEICIERRHRIVAVRLSEYRCRRDTHHPRVAMHDRRVRDLLGARRETVAIDKQKVRPQTEPGHGAMHSQEGGAKDVHPVDLLRCRHPDGPRHGLTLDHLTQSPPSAIGELLAVVQLLVAEVRWQDDGRRKHRSGQTATACFVAARLRPAGFQKGQEHLSLTPRSRPCPRPSP